MEFVTFTLIAAGLYLASDRLLDQIERARGARFQENRQLVFLAIILSLTLPTFWLIQALQRAPG